MGRRSSAWGNHGPSPGRSREESQGKFSRSQLKKSLKKCLTLEKTTAHSSKPVWLTVREPFLQATSESGNAAVEAAEQSQAHRTFDLNIPSPSRGPPVHVPQSESAMKSAVPVLNEMLISPSSQEQSQKHRFKRQSQWVRLGSGGRQKRAKTNHNGRQTKSEQLNGT